MTRKDDGVRTLRPWHELDPDVAYPAVRSYVAHALRHPTGAVTDEAGSWSSPAVTRDGAFRPHMSARFDRDLRGVVFLWDRDHIGLEVEPNRFGVHVVDPWYRENPRVPGWLLPLGAFEQMKRKADPALNEAWVDAGRVVWDWPAGRGSHATPEYREAVRRMKEADEARLRQAYFAVFPAAQPTLV